MTTRKEATKKSKAKQEAANANVVTYGDLFERYKMLNQRLDLSGLALLWKRDRNLQMLRKITKDIERLHLTKSKEFMEYEMKHHSLFERLSVGEDGKARTKSIMNPSTNQMEEVYDVDVESTEYISAKDALMQEYQKAIAEREESQTAYSNLMDTPFPGELRFQYVNLEDVPEAISEKAFSAISWMIIE